MFEPQGFCRNPKSDIIHEVRYPEWLTNPVVVPKKGGKERMCVDFTNHHPSSPSTRTPLLAGLFFPCNCSSSAQEAIHHTTLE